MEGLGGGRALDIGDGAEGVVDGEVFSFWLWFWLCIMFIGELVVGNGGALVSVGGELEIIGALGSNPSRPRREPLLGVSLPLGEDGGEEGGEDNGEVGSERPLFTALQRSKDNISPGGRGTALLGASNYVK